MVITRGKCVCRMGKRERRCGGGSVEELGSRETLEGTELRLGGINQKTSLIMRQVDARIYISQRRERKTGSQCKEKQNHHSIVNHAGPGSHCLNRWGHGHGHPPVSIGWYLAVSA